MRTDMNNRRWYVVQTDMQSEVRAMNALRASRVARVYMPVMKKTIIHHRTKQPINKRLALFNRYLFVSLDPGCMDFGKVMGCKGVDTVLGIDLDGQPCEVSRDIVKRFMLAQRRGEFDDVVALTKMQMARKIPIGSTIKVRHEHPFGGFYGQVTKIQGKGVIRAGFELFGRLVNVELSAADFDAIAA